MATVPRERNSCNGCVLHSINFCDNLGLRKRDKAVVVPFNTVAKSANVTLFKQHSRCDEIAVLCEGWAIVEHRIASGRRQIVSILLPGDVMSTKGLFSGTHMHAIRSVTDVTYKVFNAQQLVTAMSQDFTLVKGVADVCVLDDDMQVGLLVDLGQRRGPARFANLLLTIEKRLVARGLAENGCFRFPLRQKVVADIIGLSVIYLSKLISELRSEGIISFEGDQVTLLKKSSLIDLLD